LGPLKYCVYVFHVALLPINMTNALPLCQIISPVQSLNV